MLREFRAFILRGNLVDLAVAVVVGTAFTAVVNALVKDIVTPLIAAIGGEPDFGGLAFTINGSRFAYGDFFNAVLTFLIVAAVMFFLVIKPVNVLMDRFATEDGGRVADPPVPRVPVADPARRDAVRVLHDRGRAGPGVGGRHAAAPAHPDHRVTSTAITVPGGGASRYCG